MKLSDYVADFLVKEGIHHVFAVTGGAVAHLLDSAAAHPKIKPVFHHHEQAAALAAQAYGRIRKGLGACLVTTGPGGTNAITGVCAAWLDSVPCLYISGQARLEHTSRGKGVRQIGTQELDIVSLVSPITKYAVLVDDPAKIRYYLEKAVTMAKSGRPGPVWVDIPLNFQWASVNPKTLKSFSPGEEKFSVSPEAALKRKMDECLKWLGGAKRPLVVAGHGIRLAHAEEEFRRFVEFLKIPFVSTWNAGDILPTGHALYAGRPGVAGQRGANLAVQNCDFLLSIGSRLAIPVTGTLPNAFAPGARKVMVDRDPAEMKNRHFRVDLPIPCDAKIFLKEMLDKVRQARLVTRPSWRLKCLGFHTKYNRLFFSAGLKAPARVNPYFFVDWISGELTGRDTVVVDGGGTVVYVAFGAFRVKKGQRLILSSGLCAMGTGLPESIGACFAGNQGRTICFCGDGSMQWNIQELQTIVHHKLPIKIFVFNNDGYLSIRQTQEEFLGKRYVGSGRAGGLTLPDFVKVAHAYGLPAVRVNHPRELKKKVRQALRSPGPALCEILMARDQEVIPRVGFDKKPDGTHAPRSLEDMAPYLGREELRRNMRA